MQVWPGQPYPQGATWDGAGVNFALFSENATAVELCLFDSNDPARGHRFNPAKLLLDPYAKAINGTMKWSDEVFAYRLGDERGDLAVDERDSAPHVPKCV